MTLLFWYIDKQTVHNTNFFFNLFSKKEKKTVILNHVHENCFELHSNYSVHSLS